MANKKKARRDGLVEIKREIGTDHLGKIIRKSFYGKTLKEADQKYKDFLTSRMEPEYNKGITFAEWSETWLEEYKRPNIKDCTYKRTYLPVKRVLDEDFGARTLASIFPVELQRYFNGLAGMSDSYISKYKMFLSAMMRSAVDNDLLDKSPMRSVVVPSGYKPAEKRAYTALQYKRVLEYAKEDKEGLGPYIMLKTGLRRSELLGLRWSDIDRRDLVVNVRRAVTMENGKTTAGPCKTKQSVRSIPVDREFIDHVLSFPRTSTYILGAWMGKNLPYNPDGWSKGSYRRFCLRMANECPDLPVLNSHELRHTYGSVLYNGGTDIYTVSKLMGHSKIDITAKIYVHTSAEDLRKKMRFEDSENLCKSENVVNLS